MGLSLASEAVGTCGAFAAGASAASACAFAKAECHGRICHVGPGEEVPVCAGAGCIIEQELNISGVVHSVELPQGILGSFKNNEPVIGFRAHTLPYVQAIGEQPIQAQLPARMLGLGAAPASCVCDFNNFPFVLPKVRPSDDVSIAFGTRTVLKLSFWGAARMESAPLDFTVLGEVHLPLRRILCVAQPAEVCVPITPSGESLPHVARVRLTLSVAEGSGGPGLVTAVEATTNRSFNGTSAISLRRELSERDGLDVDTEILQLEEQLRRLKEDRSTKLWMQNPEDLYTQATIRHA